MIMMGQSIHYRWVHDRVCSCQPSSCFSVLLHKHMTNTFTLPGHHFSYSSKCCDDSKQSTSFNVLHKLPSGYGHSWHVSQSYFHPLSHTSLSHSITALTHSHSLYPKSLLPSFFLSYGGIVFTYVVYDKNSAEVDIAPASGKVNRP